MAGSRTVTTWRHLRVTVWYRVLLGEGRGPAPMHTYFSPGFINFLAGPSHCWFLQTQVNYNSAFPPCVSLASAHLHYSNLYKGHSIYPYPFSLTKPTILSFPVCANTFRKAGEFPPRSSLENQFVCLSLLEESQVTFTS